MTNDLMTRKERIEHEIWWLEIELKEATLTDTQRTNYEGVLEGIKFMLSLDEEKVYK